MVTTRYSDQQGSKSRQKVMRLYKRWHRPITKRLIKLPLLHIREQPRSTRIFFAYPRPAFSATNRTNTFQPVLINNSKFLKATHRTKIRKIEIPRSMVVEALSCWSRRASQHPAVTKPCASSKKPHESCPFAAPCGPRRKKNDRGRRSAFPSETSRFAHIYLYGRRIYVWS